MYIDEINIFGEKVYAMPLLITKHGLYDSKLKRLGLRAIHSTTLHLMASVAPATSLKMCSVANQLGAGLGPWFVSWQALGRTER